ncbi:MAG: ABC transporter ATP-binding protein [Chloroflexi bacterium]|nr:ABC transporter ATP-binding protein [Chloroflexota bacterium]
MPPLLEVRDLHAHFVTRMGTVKAVNGVSFTLEEGQVLGLVGESGSGKSTFALSLVRLTPFPGEVVGGTVMLNGRDLMQMSEIELQQVRGKEIGIVLQDANAALNPTLRIDNQMVEALEGHLAMGRKQAERLAVDLLRDMGLPDAREMMKRYPYQVSGGQAQRIMLAMALALSPKIIVADEPTANLDVTIQAEILARLRRLQKQNGAAILYITHDLGVVSRIADEIAVIYAGSIMERASTRNLFDRPTNPYTHALLRSLPRIDVKQQRLESIQGQPPDLMDLPDECPFLPRCGKALATCRVNPKPGLVEMYEAHFVACFNPMDPEGNLR